MDNATLANELVLLLKSEDHHRGDVSDVVREFLDMGAMDRDQALRAVLKFAWRHEHAKNGNRTNSAAKHVAACYGVTVSLVKKCIYHHKDIKF